MLENISVLMSLMLMAYLTKKMYWHIMIITMMMLTMKSIMFFNINSLVMTSSLTLTDIMSSSLITLSFWVTSLMFMASYKTLNNNVSPKLFSLMCIILLISLLGSFSASSMLMFYIMFEASLIPTMVLIMTWGYQPERMQASMYLMMYTITASLPLLIMILIMYSKSKHVNMSMPDQLLEIKSSHLMWTMMILGFLVKLPLFSMHLWLPKAHVEAPVAGSMILAAILLKLGGYGLARMVMMFNYMNKLLVAPIVSIAIIGGVITSMICLRQTDMKSLIAYSSVGHMGLMVAGMLSNSKLGMQASLAMMIAHGLSSSAMFCMANINYNMTATRSILLTKGMMCIMPNMSMWWFMFSCANMAAPPSINLMSEIMLIITIMKQSMMVIIPLSLISFITVAYSLYLYSSTNHGPNMNMSAPMISMKISDMNLMTFHLIPIVMIMLKPEMIMSWC